jgi:ferric-dicitrate binding protein FerR (iron transport regulator)
MFNKWHALVGWLVITLGKPLAKRKAKKKARVGEREGIIAGAVAATGAALAGLLFWRKRKGEGEESPQS